MNRHRIPLCLALAALGFIFPAPGWSYFEIELQDGGRVLADSYRVEGEKVLVYRGEIALELEKSAVKAIQDRGGDRTPALSSPPAAGEVSAATPQPVGLSNLRAGPTPRDLTALENELTRKLILSNRDLLFAQNRGEDEEAIRKRKDEIQRLQKDREELRKRLKR